MSSRAISDNWQRGSPYERFIGRWSRRVAPRFLAWLDLPAGRRWLDVGCGTGALCEAILDTCAPASLVGVEPSSGFLALAKERLGERATFAIGDATSLPLDDGDRDAVVSGLVLNFVPNVSAALDELLRVTASGGTVAAYVWDYADGMELLRRFWDTAVALDPSAASLHEGTRFPLCSDTALRRAFETAGLADVATAPLDQPAAFSDFDDYWEPFLGGQGPAPAYVASLPPERRELLRDTLRASLAPAGGGFSLGARAWAVRGVKRPA